MLYLRETPRIITWNCFCMKSSCLSPPGSFLGTDILWEVLWVAVYLFETFPGCSVLSAQFHVSAAPL